ncbi:MAG: HDIG domain-containing protein [Deltaproteobacteria bacterium]|nr:HDIG domain-containing protein [Deltaproteobacteria bacterium]
MATPFLQEKTRQVLHRQGIRKAALLLAVALTVTLLLAPVFDLVTFATVDEGETIAQDIVVKENVNLVDDRSTQARRTEAAKDFPPIFDHDTRLKARTFMKLANAFEVMRQVLKDRDRERSSWEARVRQNSMDQLMAQSQLALVKAQIQLIQKESRFDKRSGDGATPEEKALAAEKTRFDQTARKALLAEASQAEAQLESQLRKLRREVSQIHADAGQAERLRQDELKNRRADLEAHLNIPIDESVYRALLKAEFSKDVEILVQKLLDPVLDQKIVDSVQNLPLSGGVIQIQNLDTPLLQRFTDLGSVIDLETAKGQVKKNGQSLTMPAGLTNLREAVVNLAVQLLRPTLTENKAETERQRGNLQETVSPVFFNLKKGDVVARTGDRATAQQVEVIKALNRHQIDNPKYPMILGTFFTVLLILILFYQLAKQFSKGKFTTLSRLVLVSILLLFPLLFAKVVLSLVPVLTMVYPIPPPITYNYMLPVALSSMLAGVLLGFEAAILLGFITSLFMTLFLGMGLPYFVFALLGSMAASLPMTHFDTRYALWRQGLKISLIQVPVLLLMALLNQVPLDGLLAMNLVGAFVNGLGVAFLTTTLLPFLETGFDITTNSRLLELSNMNHPALKELSVRAPGTYHHSIVVGNLADSAADGVGANALLVRVAAYYHDLGKMLCPLYFVENQHTKNYHDDLPAQTSARIIISHVRNGLEIAKRYKLGQAITDILEQHHGDGMVRFFFHKAKKESEDMGGGGDVDEMNFRYPGPKPQTKEAGVVMLADITESATRSLKDPSETNIREMVQKQTTRVYTEGQLDESGMTFNDMNYIERTFTKMLLSIHHHRIAYPDLKVARRAMEDEGEHSHP